MYLYNVAFSSAYLLCLVRHVGWSGLAGNISATRDAEGLYSIGRTAHCIPSTTMLIWMDGRHSLHHHDDKNNYVKMPCGCTTHRDGYLVVL